jgi:hypothetical protein
MGVRRNTSGQFRKYDDLFRHRNNFDLLIIGSSRAESQFDPDSIAARTGLSCYNAGLLGATMPFIEGDLNAYLENSPAPEYVILNMDYHMFNASDDSIRQFPSYFPFLDNSALYRAFSSRDRRFPFFKYVPFYSMPYFGTRYLNVSIRGWIDQPGKYDTAYHHGHLPIVVNRIKGLDTVSIEHYRPSFKPSSWESFLRICSTCRSKNIELIIVYSPLFHRLSESIMNEEQIISKIDSVAGSYDFHTMNYRLNALSYNSSCYSDLDHLNWSGSRVFSHLFAMDLAQYLRH